MATIPIDTLIEAKRQVLNYARRGKLLSPRDAWLLSGHVKDAQTLWSISFDLARKHDFSAEDLCDILDRIFPQYTTTRGHVTEWHDITHAL